MGDSTFEYYTENDDCYKPEEISAIILKKIVADCSEFLGETVDSAVITVPAYFGDAERKATEDAGKIAGVKVLALINEPTAAAIAYGVKQMNKDATIMIYDLGGGTFDVSILELSGNDFKVCSTNGNKDLGGNKFDVALMRRINTIIERKSGYDPVEDDELQAQVRELAEEMKIELSSQKWTRREIIVKGDRIPLYVTRSEFEEMIRLDIESTGDSIRDALEEANKTIRDIDKVILVGGSTRIPYVQEYVCQLMHTEPVYSKDVHPDEAVAIGAAYFAVSLSGSRSGIGRAIALQDVNSHGLGIVSLDEETGRLVNTIVIPRNTCIPSEEVAGFETVVDNQRAIRVTVTEGDDTDLRYVTKIGETLIQLEPHPKGYPLLVKMTLDKNAIIHVYAYAGLDDRRYLGEMEIDRKANMDQRDVAEKMRKMNETKVI
ncbi:MAG: Hsp70 family protein, partial [Lachnospiraceae bacterium]|nr:Hsp70 family protein [Lachnospiraceae bacterium]